MWREYHDEHVSVLVEEVLKHLVWKTDGVYVDCTVGEGGHAFSILSRFPGVQIVGIDRDEEVLEIARKKLEIFGKRCRLFKAEFSRIDELFHGLQLEKVDGFLLDLGVSTYQLMAKGRGFSFNRDEPLDMRMDLSQFKTAWYVVNTYPEEELERILREYGEEPFARRIARNIVAMRPINSTGQLVEAVVKAIPKKVRRKRHPATRTFQAIRIEVNDELKNLAKALEKLPDFLNTGGRIVVISFHSLEDRIVKRAFRDDKRLKIITKKVIKPSFEEVKENIRARSARMRVAERI